jgi:hypothetical protein
MKKLFMFPFLMITMASLACNTVTSLPARLLDTPTVECSQFNLTPEECANAGAHQYTTSEKVLFDQTGQTCQTGSDDVIVSFTFLTNDTFLYVNSYGIETEFTRKEKNVYTGERVQPDGEFIWKNTITFTEDGFFHEASSYEVKNNFQRLCTFMIEQKLK